MKSYEWSGDYKAIARSKALDFVSTSEYAGILLPSNECRCAVAALEGTVQPNKPMHILERQSSILSVIKNKLEKIGYTDCHFHRRLEDIVFDKPVDWAYLDFIGSIDELTYNWMRHRLSPNLAPCFRLSFCWNYAWRPECPFLKMKHELFQSNGVLWNISCRYDCEGDSHLATYISLIEEMFPQAVICRTDTKPFFKYNDNVNPMVLYTIRSLKQPTPNPIVMGDMPMKTKTKTKTKTKQLNDNLESLLTQFSVVNLKAWRLACDRYCKRRSEETGTPPIRFFAAVKMRLTKLGYDTSLI